MNINKEIHVPNCYLILPTILRAGRFHFLRAANLQLSYHPNKSCLIVHGWYLGSFRFRVFFVCMKNSELLFYVIPFDTWRYPLVLSVNIICHGPLRHTSGTSISRISSRTIVPYILRLSMWHQIIYEPGRGRYLKKKKKIFLLYLARIGCRYNN